MAADEHQRQHVVIDFFVNRRAVAISQPAGFAGESSGHDTSAAPLIGP